MQRESVFSDINAAAFQDFQVFKGWIPSTVVWYKQVNLFKVHELYDSSSEAPSSRSHGWISGETVSKWTEGNFNYVWIDYVLEATEYKALNGTGGITKLKLKGHALATLISCQTCHGQISHAIPSHCVQKANKTTNSRNASLFGHNSSKMAVRQGYENHWTNVLNWDS